MQELNRGQMNESRSHRLQIAFEAQSFTKQIAVRYTHEYHDEAKELRMKIEGSAVNDWCYVHVPNGESNQTTPPT